MNNQLKLKLLKLTKYGSFVVALVSVMRLGEWVYGN
jgi:hypothetical protein